MIVSKIPAIIDKFYDDLIISITKDTNEKAIGIFDGQSGITFFLSLFYQLKKQDETLDIISNLLSSTLNNLQQANHNSALSGYTGILWSMLALRKKKLLGDEIDDYITEFVSVILTSVEEDLQEKNLDLLHGLMGKLLILSRASEVLEDNKQINSIKKAIDKGIDNIISAAVVIDHSNEAYWEKENLHKDLVSVGLAHGQSSYIWFLSTILIEKGDLISPQIQRVMRIRIKQACDFMINRLTNSEDYSCVARNYISVKNTISPPQIHSLGWCNGGLGVLIAIQKANDILRVEDLSSFLNRFTELLTEIRQTDSGIWQDDQKIDNSLCHGTFGVFFFFYMLHRNLKIPSLKDAYRYWLEVSIQKMNWEKPFFDLSSCKVIYTEKTIKQLSWKTPTNLLNGASGHSLTLLTYLLLEENILEEKDILWFRIFI